MANLTATRHLLLAGAAVTVLANFPALAASEKPADLTLVCANPSNQFIVEVWFDPEKLIINHTDVFTARIDDRTIRFEGNIPDPYTHGATLHTVGVIDRTTGFYQASVTSTVPSENQKFPAITAQCLKEQGL